MNNLKFDSNKFDLVKYKKINFLKNKTNEGGALHEILKIKDEHPKKSEQKAIMILNTKRNFRLYGITEQETIYKNLFSNIGLYEIIDSYPFKIYFDIDKATTPEECKKEEEERIILNKIKNIISKDFEGCKFSISGSIEKNKISYHIILNNYLITTEEEKEILKLIVKKYIIDYPFLGFDCVVYKKNQLMKAINQAKRDRKPQAIIEDPEPKNHLIKSFLPSTFNKIKSTMDKLPLELEHIKFYSNQEQKIKNDLSSLPNLSLKLPDNINYETLTAGEILGLLPMGPEFPHWYSFKTARFCFFNGLSFDIFYDWYKQKRDTKEDYKRWRYHWEKIENGRFEKVLFYDMLRILNMFYKGFFNSLKMNNLKYLFELDEDKKIIIDTLKPEHFENDKKALIFNLGMGTGKTAQTINFLKKYSNKSFIFLSPRKSLITNTAGRMKEQKINFDIYDIFNYKNEKGEKITKAEHMNKKNNLLCVINSIHYLKKSFDFVIIDEIETVLNSLYKNKTLNEPTKTGGPAVFSKVWEALINLLLKAEKIILLDAFTTKKTTDLLKSLNIGYNIYEQPKKEATREAVEIPDFHQTLKKIIKDLKNDKKLIIFYPYKNSIKDFKTGNIKYPSMSELLQILEHHTKKRGLFYNADIEGKRKTTELKDVNETWKHQDFIISNNIITVGVNFDIIHFNKIYSFIEGFNLPRDIIQFSYRARSIKDKTLYFNIINTRYNDNGHQEEPLNYKEEYEILKDNILKEKKAPSYEALFLFFNKALYNVKSESFETKFLNRQEIIKNKIISKEKELLDIPDENEEFIIFKNDFEEEEFYKYENIYDISKLPEAEQKKEIFKIYSNIYKGEGTHYENLQLEKYEFNKKFNKEKITAEEMAEIWNDNKIKLINNIFNILLNDNNLLNKLSKNYKWSLLFSEDIEKQIITDKEKEQIINITATRKEKLFLYNNRKEIKTILKNFINSSLGYKIYITKKDKQRKIKIIVDDKIKQLFVIVMNSLNTSKIEMIKNKHREIKALKEAEFINCELYNEEEKREITEEQKAINNFEDVRGIIQDKYYIDNSLKMSI